MIDRSKKQALAHLSRVVVFTDLAQTQSFRSTAKNLGLSPSTVTHHIQALEAAVGIRLIERTSRTMALTTAGEAFLHEVQGIVEAFGRGTARARLHAEAPVGTLVITAPDVVAERFVIPAIRTLTGRYEAVDVDLRVSTHTLDLLAEGIDLAVRMGPLPDSGHGVRTLHRGQHGIVCTPELARTWAPQHPRDLAQAPWVRFDPHPEQPRLVGPEGEHHTLTATSRARATAAGAFIGLVEAGAGFGLIPRMLVARAIHDGRLAVVLPEWSLGPANFYAVTPSPRAGDVKVRLFTDILVDQFTTAGPEAPSPHQ